MSFAERFATTAAHIGMRYGRVRVAGARASGQLSLRLFNSAANTWAIRYSFSASRRRSASKYRCACSTARSSALRSTEVDASLSHTCIPPPFSGTCCSETTASVLYPERSRPRHLCFTERSPFCSLPFSVGSLAPPPSPCVVVETPPQVRPCWRGFSFRRFHPFVTCAQVRRLTRPGWLRPAGGSTGDPALCAADGSAEQPPGPPRATRNTDRYPCETTTPAIPSQASPFPLLGDTGPAARLLTRPRRGHPFPRIAERPRSHGR